MSGGAYRDDAALAAEADDCVVGAGTAGGRVDDDEDLLVFDEREGLCAEEVVDVRLAEDLLEAVEGEARELGLDEVRAVLHHDLELAVALGALPLGDEVEHVDLSRKNRGKVSGGGPETQRHTHGGRKTQKREKGAAEGAGTVSG